MLVDGQHRDRHTDHSGDHEVLIILSSVNYPEQYTPNTLFYVLFYRLRSSPKLLKLMDITAPLCILYVETLIRSVL